MFLVLVEYSWKRREDMNFDVLYLPVRDCEDDWREEESILLSGDWPCFSLSC